MARTPRSVARRRAMAIVTVGATIASGSALLAPATSSASSHREAPYISSDPTVDNTDVYAFNDKNDSKKVNFVANWAPFSDPAGGPTFYPWATDAAYDIDIDNNGDAKADVIYRWEFTNVDNRGNVNHGDAKSAPGDKPGTFLYADGAVTSLDDVNLLFKQTYKLTELDANPAGTVTANGGQKFTAKTLVASGTAAPSNIGRGTIPDYAPLRRQAVASGQIAGGAGGQSYVGQADDPFFLDLRVFDLLYGGPGSGFFEAGNDTLKHYDVNTIALQVPKADVALGGLAAKGGNPVIGVWSTTSRKSQRVFTATNGNAGGPETTDTGEYAQVSRLGNPLVNEVVVPAQLKDTFNRITPDVDAGVTPVVNKVLDPEVPYLVKGIYGVPNVNTYNPKTGAYDSTKRDRQDLFTIFLTGVAGLNNINDNATHATQRPAEYLRINLSTPVTAKPNRLGVAGGDAQGFPNGRRLTDDITDEILQVAEGSLIYNGTFGAVKPTSPDAKAYAAAVAGLGDGVSVNDKPFLNVFPYIADPTSGSAVTQVKAPVRFYQNLMSYRGRVYIAVGGVAPASPGATVLIYRKNTDGTTTLIRKTGLNAAGTMSATTTVDQPSTSARTVYYTIKVIPKGLASDTVAAQNNGTGTNVTINR